MGKNTDSSNSSIINRIAAWLVICIVALSLLGYVAWQKVGNNLNEALESSVSKQMDTLTNSLGQQFRQELSDMHHISWLVGSGRLSPDVFVDSFTVEQEGIYAGIESMDDLLNGEDLEDRIPVKESFYMTSNLLDGKPAVTYWKDHGLVFATPIMDNNTGEVSGVFYRIYNNAAMLDRFKLLSYDGEGSLVLYDETGPLGSLTKGRVDPISVKKMCRDTELSEHFEKLSKTLHSNSGSSMQVDYQQTHYFLSGARVPDTELLVMGYIPWMAVAAEFNSVYLAMLVAFGIALAIIIAASLYFFRPRKENHESEAPKASRRNVIMVTYSNDEDTPKISDEITINTSDDVSDFDTSPKPEPKQASPLLQRLKAEVAPNPPIIGDFNESFDNSFKSGMVSREKFTAPDAKILVVDDTTMNLTVVKGLLRKTKIQVDTVESGKESLELVQTNKYDIVFIDHRMPDMDGIETLHKIREMVDYPNSETPMISLIGNAVSEARDESISEGFDDCLTKPIHSDQLEALILKYLPKEKVSMADAYEEDDYELAWLESIPKWNQAKESEPEHTPDEMQEESLEGEQESENVSDQEQDLKYEPEQDLKQEVEQDTDLNQEEDSHQEQEPEHEHGQDKEQDLKDAYEAMRSAAASSDHEGLTFVLDALDEYDFSPEQRERYEAIKEAAAIPDWDKINDLLKPEIQD